MKRRGHATGRIVYEEWEHEPLSFYVCGSNHHRRISVFGFTGDLTRGVNCKEVNFNLSRDGVEYKLIGTVDALDVETGVYHCSALPQKQVVSWVDNFDKGD